jgi:hypothetical protein
MLRVEEPFWHHILEDCKILIFIEDSLVYDAIYGIG